MNFKAIFPTVTIFSNWNPQTSHSWHPRDNYVNTSWDEFKTKLNYNEFANQTIFDYFQTRIAELIKLFLKFRLAFLIRIFPFFFLFLIPYVPTPSRFLLLVLCAMCLFWYSFATRFGYRYIKLTDPYVTLDFENNLQIDLRKISLICSLGKGEYLVQCIDHSCYLLREYVLSPDDQKIWQILINTYNKLEG